MELEAKEFNKRAWDDLLLLRRVVSEGREVNKRFWSHGISRSSISAFCHVVLIVFFDAGYFLS